MPIVDSGVYYVISTFSNTANEYFTIAYKLSGSEMGGSWFAFIKNTMSSVNWTRLDVPSFYKNYSTISNLMSGIFGGASVIPENSSVSSLGFGIHYIASVSTNHISGVPTELENSSHAITVFVWRYYSDNKSMMLIDIEGGGIWIKMSSSSNWIKV